MSCRRQFHVAAQRWALDALGVGALTVGDIKRLPAAPNTPLN
jgi:hypothetical protein